MKLTAWGPYQCQCAGADEGQRDGVCGRGGLLQSQQRHRQRRQRGERSPQHQVRSPHHDMT